MEGTKIGFLGAGNMAQAVVKGLLLSGITNKDLIRFFDIRAGKEFSLAATATKETSLTYQAMKVGKSWVQA